MAYIARSVAAPPAEGNSRKTKIASVKREVLVIEGRMMALDLKKRGCTYQQIADKLTKLFHPKGGKKVSKRTAFEYVQAELIALRQQTELDVQSVRDLDLERCDAALAGLWEGITGGNPASVMAAMKVMERRSKLLGLDAPTRTEFVGAMMTVSAADVAKMSDTEIEEKVRALMNRVTIASPANAAKLPDIPTKAVKVK